MNKDDLFYIVERGTNSRALNYTKDPLIVDNRGIISQRKWWPEDEYDVISIKKYEDTFTDKEDEDIPKSSE